MKNQLKRAVIIDDICGYGKCSMGISLPVLSAAGIDVSNIPTGVFTHHTAIKGYGYINTAQMSDEYVRQWANIGTRFDAVYSANLLDPQQVYSVISLINSNKDAIKIVDPVLGDNGRLYHNGYNNIIPHIYNLISLADVITPNITEASILTYHEYKEDPDEDYIYKILDKLKSQGCKNVVLTGIVNKDKIFNYAMFEDKSVKQYKAKYYPHKIHGAGDLFTSTMLAAMLNENKLDSAIRFATKYVESAIKFTVKQNDFEKKGICFEKNIAELTKFN